MDKLGAYDFVREFGQKLFAIDPCFYVISASKLSEPCVKTIIINKNYLKYHGQWELKKKKNVKKKSSLYGLNHNIENSK